MALLACAPTIQQDQGVVEISTAFHDASGALDLGLPTRTDFHIAASDGSHIPPAAPAGLGERGCGSSHHRCCSERPLDCSPCQAPTPPSHPLPTSACLSKTRQASLPSP